MIQSAFSFFIHFKEMVPAALGRGNCLLKQPISGTTAPFPAIVLLVILSFIALMIVFGNNGLKIDKFICASEVE